jgi:hypothetical protein
MMAADEVARGGSTQEEASGGMKYRVSIRRATRRASWRLDQRDARASVVMEGGRGLSGTAGRRCAATRSAPWFTLSLARFAERGVRDKYMTARRK